jgi:mannose-6-phosphate isomerase-like protein (cupin superfamily)
MAKKNFSNLVKVININDKLSLFNEYWDPKIVGELNNHKVQVVKLKGEFVWHHHDNEDELFLVVKGQLTIHFRDKDIQVNEGEFVIIPHPIEHKPEAKEEVHIVLIEPKGTLNTGNVTDSELAAHDQETI